MPRFFISVTLNSIQGLGYKRDPLFKINEKNKINTKVTLLY